MFQFQKGNVRINQDKIKTKEKVIKCLMQNIEKGNKIVIDSSNPQKNNRSQYIKICNKYNYPTIAFAFQVSKEFSMHLNNLRIINKIRKHYQRNVNNISIQSFFKNIEEPDTKEGFTEVVQVNFIPGPFEKVEEKNYFII